MNMPVAKHHVLSLLALCLKNGMRVIGGNRGKLHHNCRQDLADLATVVQPKMTVIDVTRMLLRNGPQGGTADDLKVADTMIATSDPAAADTSATTLFGLRRSTVLPSGQKFFEMAYSPFSLALVSFCWRACSGGFLPRSFGNVSRNG